MPALIAANAALYARRKRLRIGCIPIVGGYVPHDRGQAEFRRGPEHVWPARAERRSKPFHGLADRILDGGVAGGKLLANARGPLPKQ